jgi:hypothetical protein
VNIYFPAIRQCCADSCLQLAHLRGISWHLPISDRKSQILGLPRQDPAVIGPLTNFGQIDKGIYARFAQTREAIVGVSGILAKRVFTGEKATGHYPVAVWKWWLNHAIEL